MNWVVSHFLTEDHIRILYKESMLKDFSQCSKPTIVFNVRNYIESNESDAEVRDMLLEVYKDKIDFIDIQKDEDVLSMIDKVSAYNFSSVHAGLSVDELNSMRKTITSVYNDSYNVPYINTIPGDIIDSIINNLLALNRVNKDMEYKKLSYVLTKNKELFKDKPNANASGTAFKAVSRRSMELDLMLKGIDFLIEQKSLGRQPESWRLF